MAAIFILSAIPDLKTDLKQDFLLRKIAHMVEFGILCFLVVCALSKENLDIKKIIIYSIIFSLFYALTDEYHQTFIEGRQGTLRDVGIDSIGILIAGLVCYIKNKGRNH